MANERLYTVAPLNEDNPQITFVTSVIRFPNFFVNVIIVYSNYLSYVWLDSALFKSNQFYRISFTINVNIENKVTVQWDRFPEDLSHLIKQ